MGNTGRELSLVGEPPQRVFKGGSVRPEPVEGSKRSSWFDKLTTNGFDRFLGDALRPGSDRLMSGTHHPSG